MNISRYVRESVIQREAGSIFTYRDFSVSPEGASSLIKALSGLYRQGILARIAKGIYYKPRQTEFGVLLPSTKILLEKLLKEQRDQVAYLTGINTYNALGLTRQQAMEYVIATDRPRTPITIGKTTIRFVPARLKQAPSSSLLAQLLDALMEIKQIPDSEPTQSALILLAQFKQLSAAQRNELVALAKFYPPSTRALLGLLLEQLPDPILAKTLWQSLNPVTKFKLCLDPKYFPNTSHWHMA